MKRAFSDYVYQKTSRLAAKGKVDFNSVLECVNKMDLDCSLWPNREAMLGVGGSIIYSEIEILKGQGVHYFLDSPALPDLLCNMVKDYNASVLDILCEDRFTFAVIHPMPPNRAVLLSVMTHPSFGGTIATMIDGGLSHGTEFRAIDSNSFKNRNYIKASCYAERLAIGLCLYLRFFPNACKSGLPECAKHPAHYKGKPCRNVGVAAELVDRSGPKPHLRKCYVKFLRSEKFVHKKGTFIQVKESYVKGKCKVVVEVED